MPEATGISGGLTDGTGVSKLVLPKIVKDVIADFLLTAPVVFVTLSVNNLEQALTVPTAIILGLADAAIRVIYRALLRYFVPAQ